MTLRRVVVGVPSWNGRHHLEILLPALAAQRDPGVTWETLVLDNGSRDGTAGWIAARFPAVRVLRNEANLGFAAGVNLLVEAAAGADAVALLNNDTLPAPEWLGELVAALAGAPADVAAVSGLIVDWAGERLDFGRGVVTFDGHAFQLDYRRPLGRARLPAPGEELPFACGGNMLVRRDEMLRAGGFDPAYFAYFEDVDLGWRLWAAGRRVVAAPAAVVRHRSMATSDLLGRHHRGMLFERNAFLTAYKNLDEETWRALAPAILVTLLSRTEALLAEANPGGAQLRIDPYAGHVADTVAARPAGTTELPPREPPGTWQRLRELGAREAARRARRRLGRWIAGDLALSRHPILTDDRTVAELRALAWLFARPDRVAAARRRTQEQRRRSDREILERFPLWVVPTYPGDERLFASDLFADLLPADLPLVRARLAEVMAWGDEEPAR